MPALVDVITATDAELRHRSLDELCADWDGTRLVQECEALERFRRVSGNLYERVRALFFLAAIHRYHLPQHLSTSIGGRIPYAGFERLLERRFEEAIDHFLRSMRADGPGDGISSALALAYHHLGFQTLADQVKQSVRSVRGNQWMFRLGHPGDHPLRLREQLLEKRADGSYPVLCERTPVRMDLTHSAWSDIFFLGMDYPEGARVLNVSIDLGVYGRDPQPTPPIECTLRVLDRPVLRLESVDLKSSAEITDLAEVFDFARDYLGLLKAGVIAAGVVPPGVEGSGQSLDELLRRVVGPGRGLELVTRVNDIPKGSRLAVSTNLLAGIIAVCMRATGQAKALTGVLEEDERRLIAARAILGEWLGGSGGGWQDSGGVWPGIKLIEGVVAGEGDPEFGISRGRLLPQHRLMGSDQAPEALRENLRQSLVLVHGGMAQNVGPILEMVTEKYLLRSEPEWRARRDTADILQRIQDAFLRADVRSVGAATHDNFHGPIQTIIPWASNRYTETLIERVQQRFGEDFWGFWMLGGMSGGGMGFLFEPGRQAEARDALLEIMRTTRREMMHALPFAMDPVVYGFAINEHGTRAEWLEDNPAAIGTVAAASSTSEDNGPDDLDRMLTDLGFDRSQHEQIQDDLRRGRIGLAQNRLPVNTALEDVLADDVIHTAKLDEDDRARGRALLAEGAVAVVTLAAGSGSRWTQGAGVVKALNPFCKLGGATRTFLDVHFAKSRRTSRESGVPLPHVITTSHLTHEPIVAALAEPCQNGVQCMVSPGRSIGLRMIPTERDLRFAWEELPQQRLDEQAQKNRENLNEALIGWARGQGEGADYRDNLPAQCLHPVGHWYEVPNLLLNGVLRELLQVLPGLKTLMLHNIDTLGANVDPALLGRFAKLGRPLGFEVIARRIEDQGGGLARVNGRPRLVEGLAMPREEDEFRLSYYNSNTTWIDVAALLDMFGLTPADLDDAARVQRAVRELARRMPTYVTLKDVKKRWGHGQEDVYPVTQFEKLWGDMTALPEADCVFFAVPRTRGQQLKDPAQLDGWLRDGSAAAVEALCEF